ncbi:hypothetical protein BH10ACT2_BH10ACT2_26010 [soil metagenome]
MRYDMTFLPSKKSSADGAVGLAPRIPIRKSFKTFAPLLRPYRPALAALLVLTIATPIASGSIVWVFRHLIDDVVSRGSTKMFWHYGLLFAFASTSTSILSFLDERLTGWAQTNFVRDCRARLLDHVLRLPPDHFDTHPLGDTLARVSTDVSSAEGVFMSASLAALSSIAQVVVLGIFAFSLNWRLALLSLIVVPPFALLARAFSTRMRQVARERRRRGGSAGAVAEEILSGITVVQAHNAEDREAQRFELQAQAIIRADLASTRLNAIYRPAIDTIELIGGLVLVWFGTVMVGNQQLTIGTMIAFMAYATQLYGPVRSLSRLGTSMQSNLAGLDRVIELLETPAHEPTQTGAPPPSAARVEFDGVSFAYPSGDSEVISNISFTVEPGRSVALVGASGSGKTTIARVLLGWNRPSSGSVRINGREITVGEIGLARDAISYLPQEPWLFDGTIGENIAYGKPGATAQEIAEAAHAADAHDFIATLPGGYDSSVGRRGRLLSGGQRQRIALARAFLRNSPIVVLDEPLTSLDPLSADRIMPALRRLMAGRATLVISHHLELAENTDLVLVLDNGAIVESGPHDWLIANGAAYQQLHRKQALQSATSATFPPPPPPVIELPQMVELFAPPIPPLQRSLRRPTISSEQRSIEGIEFDRVSFAYQSGNEVVSKVSFVLEQGRTVALVGGSGSGKSAIPRLLLGNVTPTAGTIRANGRPSDSIVGERIQDAISYLPKDPLLFEGTICENIGSGRLGASANEIVAAAHAADAHSFIIALPGGYESTVGRAGRSLSSTQRQHIALARAFLRNAPILVLDEPILEDDLVPAMRRLMAGRASLVISNHLQLAPFADHILVMHGGRVIESGSHEWLINHSAAYQALQIEQGNTRAIGAPIWMPEHPAANSPRELVYR